MDNQELKKRLQEIRDILIQIERILSFFHLCISHISTVHVKGELGDRKFSAMIDNDLKSIIEQGILSIESSLSKAKEKTDISPFEEPQDIAKKPQEKVRKNKRWQQVCLYAAMGCFFIISGLTGYYAFDEVNITITPNSSSESPGQEGGRCRCDSPTSSGSPLGMFLGLGVSVTIMLSISAILRRRE